MIECCSIGWCLLSCAENSRCRRTMVWRHFPATAPTKSVGLIRFGHPGHDLPGWSRCFFRFIAHELLWGYRWCIGSRFGLPFIIRFFEKFSQLCHFVSDDLLKACVTSTRIGWRSIIALGWAWPLHGYAPFWQTVQDKVIKKPFMTVKYAPFSISFIYPIVISRATSRGISI